MRILNLFLFRIKIILYIIYYKKTIKLKREIYKMSTYWMIISCAGFVVLLILSISAFFQMEALKLPHNQNISIGFKLLLCALVSNNKIILNLSLQ